jgi:hypothetical protein
MKRGFYVSRAWLVLAAGSLALLACSSTSKQAADGQPKTLEPEQRFGNDPELVADFANLSACTYERGRLDRACEQLKTLANRLAVKRRNPDRRPKVVTTLANLLESRRELTRLVAADSLYFHHQEPKIVKAVKKALAAERVPQVKATLLRQACWRWSSWIEQLAIRSLAAKSPELVRAESASCLGRHLRAAKKAIAPLRQALGTDPSSRVKGNVCAALAGLQDTDSVHLLAKQLEVEGVGWRCGTALAALGTKEAYRALKGWITRALDQGKPFPAQHVSALASFTSKPFFEQDQVLTLLTKVAADKRLGWLGQRRAVQELGKLGGEEQLRELRRSYQGSADNPVVREIERWLAPKKI